ncbi:MAG TPA: FAD:protein FMN transferase [Rhodanobacteraceae bacterium]|nr:FAD:protein FMN transferase [Rhodanobacteraceae bacterium]
MRIRRARPLLGTLVDIRVDTIDEACAQEAIEAAFAEIADVHRLMSFHEATSDVSRINRDASRAPVAVDVRTREVLALALAFSCESQGRFDPTIATELVAWGRLPLPSDAPAPARDASWQDIAILEDGRIRAAKPLWIDLGGIAKGYAVDRAIERLIAFGIEDACVNAGGDLRRIGGGTEPVHIRAPSAPQHLLRTLLLGEGSVASSGGYFERAHVDATTRTPMRDRCVSVVADRCAVADALTKIVMSDAVVAAPLLDAWNAEALVLDDGDAHLIGRAA